MWNLITCQPEKIFKTYHKNGIINLTFSADGVFILSSGIDKNFRFFFFLKLMNNSIDMHKIIYYYI